ncbi:unnamed protein product [Albugo candida]|uniref:Uncharacterized protein n=1 Tax=Albugo candida TaxID=65357 RepID=A0A024FVF5_9STRA|nr:unnamed protein product [Albugo candida]|eukprot:CCI11105.1 unnamed protein product [Albugo candida]
MSNRNFQVISLILSLTGITPKHVTRNPHTSVRITNPESMLTILADNVCMCDNVLSMEVLGANAYDIIETSLGEKVKCEFFNVDTGKAEFTTGAGSSIYGEEFPKIDPGFTTLNGCSTETQCEQTNKLATPTCENKGNLFRNVAFLYKDGFPFNITYSPSLENCIAESKGPYIRYEDTTKLCLEMDKIHSIVACDGFTSGNRTSRFEK